MRDRNALKKSDLLAALSDLVDVDPEEYAGETVRCHFCLAAEGHLHRDDCGWLEAAILCRGEASIARRRVGEDLDDFEDRMEDDEDYSQDDALDLKALALAARQEMAELTSAEVPDLDEPLDAPTPWEPEE